MAEDTTTAASIDLFSISPPRSPTPEVAVTSTTKITSPINANAPSFVPASASTTPTKQPQQRKEKGNPFGLAQEVRGPKKVASSEVTNAEGDEEKETPRRRKEPYVREIEPKREKLSEDALSEKLAAMKLRNAQLTAQREAALADESQYSSQTVLERQELEKQQAQQAALAKQRKELQASIDAERKQNAERKLAKLAGRDWDKEKEGLEWKKGSPVVSNPESDGFGGGDREQSFGGSGGRYEQSYGSWDQARDDRRENNFRGRGSRGRGARARGRGNGQTPAQPREKKLDVKDQEAFPALVETPAVAKTDDVKVDSSA